MNRIPRKKKKRYKKEYWLCLNTEFWQFLQEQTEENQELIRKLLTED